MLIRPLLCVLASAPLALALPSAGVDTATALAPDWETGAVEFESVGVLAFGPDGILFVADHQAAQIVALKLENGSQAKPAEASFAELNIENVDEVLSFLLGTTRDDVTIHDVAVDPASGAAILSVTRGGGDKAQHALVALRANEDYEVLDLSAAKHLRLALDNAPEPDGDGRRSKRAQSITDLAFHNGVLYVAGLSNEEFASKLHALQFPFAEAGRGASIEIYHGAHGAWETRAPVRTMLPIILGGEDTLLCGYTCTPLVRVPVNQIEGVEKFVGTTVAELGNRNVPLDMITYEKDGKGYLLIANSSRGVMKLGTAGLESAEGLTERISGTAGHPYETLEEFEGVSQLALLDAKHALILVQTKESASLRTIDLP